jgi:citrate synthase
MAEGPRLPKGLAGVSVTETRIAKSDANGTLVYRGYPISEIAANSGFEETAYLILNGSLPTKAELEKFSSRLWKMQSVEARVFTIMRELGRGAHPVDVLRTATSALGSIDEQDSVADQQASIEGKMSVLVANCRGIPRGEKPKMPKEGLGYAANLLQMLTKKEASDYEKWVFERVLIFYMEHDLNASSFTVRVVASTLADPYAATSAGLAALKGALHGGANEAAMQMLLEIGEPEKVGEYVERAFKEGRKVVGFGTGSTRNSTPGRGCAKSTSGKCLVGEATQTSCTAFAIRSRWRCGRGKTSRLTSTTTPPRSSTCSASRCHYTPQSSLRAGSSVGWHTTMNRWPRTSLSGRTRPMSVQVVYGTYHLIRESRINAPVGPPLR